MSEGFFSARVFFYDESAYEVECWSDELEPMDLRRTVADWATEHLQGSWNCADLRKELGVPKTGDYQVFFKGKIRCWHVPYPTDEWDEDFEPVGEVQVAEIPKHYSYIRWFGESLVPMLTCDDCGAKHHGKVGDRCPEVGPHPENGRHTGYLR